MQRTVIWFPAPTRCPTTVSNADSKGFCTPSDLFGILPACDVQAYTQMHTYIQNEKYKQKLSQRVYSWSHCTLDRHAGIATVYQVSLRRKQTGLCASQRHFFVCPQCNWLHVLALFVCRIIHHNAVLWKLWFTTP